MNWMEISECECFSIPIYLCKGGWRSCWHSHSVSQLPANYTLWNLMVPPAWINPLVVSVLECIGLLPSGVQESGVRSHLVLTSLLLFVFCFLSHTHVLGWEDLGVAGIHWQSAGKLPVSWLGCLCDKQEGISVHYSAFWQDLCWLNQIFFYEIHLECLQKKHALYWLINEKGDFYRITSTVVGFISKCWESFRTELWLYGGQISTCMLADYMAMVYHFFVLSNLAIQLSHQPLLKKILNDPG